VLLLAKHTHVHAEKTRGARLEVTQKVHEKTCNAASNLCWQSVGAKDFLPKFSQTCAKSGRVISADRFYGVTSKKMVFTCFSANLGLHFSKSNNVGSHFCSDFR